MYARCPKCELRLKPSDPRPDIVRRGQYRRKSDCRDIQRFHCKGCDSGFSAATSNACVNQNKRQINNKIYKLYSSGLSQRRLARILHCSRTTIARKLLFLGAQAEIILNKLNSKYPKATKVQFDDLLTFEHTKCKPISATVAVTKCRRILGLDTASMPAFGKLKDISLKKYGKREDTRPQAREKVLKDIKPFIDDHALFETDQHPHYPQDVKRIYPLATHMTYKSKRGSSTGQGELKGPGFDPIFSVNHTLAMFRANVNRLFRRTWNTTKRMENLRCHMFIYALYHNTELL
jgi:transposase-like protein